MTRRLTSVHTIGVITHNLFQCTRRQCWRYNNYTKTHFRTWFLISFLCVTQMQNAKLAEDNGVFFFKIKWACRSPICGITKKSKREKSGDCVSTFPCRQKVWECDGWMITPPRLVYKRRGDEPTEQHPSSQWLRLSWWWERRWTVVGRVK